MRRFSSPGMRRGCEAASVRGFYFGRGAAAACLWLLLSGAAALGDNPTERVFMWNEANARMATARTPREFGAAADAYRRLAAAGGHSGVLFYNLGTACLKAEQHDQAVDALLRAERYMGTTPDIERNLILATARGKKDKTAALPWYRLVLFWHYGLPAASRVAVAATAFSGLWLALAFRLAGWRKPAGPLMALSLVALILFGSSAFTSLYEESKADVRDRIEQPPRMGP